MLRNFHLENGSMSQIPTIDFDLFLAEHRLNPLSWEDKDAFIRKSDMHIMIKGQNCTMTKSPNNKLYFQER